MLVIPFSFCLLFVLSVSEVTSQHCHSARRFCPSVKDRRRCRIAVGMICKCKDYESFGNCDTYSPRTLFEQEVQRKGRDCTPKRCRLKVYWCHWSYWKTDFSNSSCAGTLYHQKRVRKRCCNDYRLKISNLCKDKYIKVEYKRRRYFKESDDGCEIPGAVGMPWYEKMGYGIAVSVGFAFVVKCLRAWCCRKKQQTPPEEDMPPPATEENFENARLGLPEDGDSGPPEAVPLDPTAPPPSYDEVTDRPDKFEPPPCEKRY